MMAVITETVGDCELAHDGLLYQPANAFSSLAYLLVAVVLLLILRSADRSATAWAYAAVLALVGMSSADFHGPRSAVAQFSHDFMVVVLLAFAVLVPVIRLLRRTQALPGLSAPRIWAVAALLAVALVTWFLGRTDSTLCSPESLLQWHALWHTLSALTFGVWGLVLFARSPAESSRQAASDQTEVLQ